MTIQTSCKIGESFSGAADTYEQYADIQNLLANELLEELKREKVFARDILDIGCGTGRLLLGLSKILPKAKIRGLDISSRMARITKDKGIPAVVADAQNLPFRREVFDLITSNATYQWIFNLKDAFSEACRVLKKEGVFIFNCFGHRTLCELRDCFNIRENLLPSKDGVYKNLKSANFSDIEIKVELRQKYFDSLESILYWLKKIGANRIFKRQPFLTPRKFKIASDFYSYNYGNNGKVYATFEVIMGRIKK